MSDDIQILKGDARHLPLDDESVQLIVTSPPYWGLRKYAGEQELIWPNGTRTQGIVCCNRGDHKWSTSTRTGGGRVDGKERWNHTGHGEHGHETASTDTCELCGAWRGAFGLEPTIEMYVAHTVEILRELRRVLRPDGVCFLNLGDSYYGAGYSNNKNTGGATREQGGKQKHSYASSARRDVQRNGRDGKEPQYSTVPDCACSCHDDVHSGASLSRNADTLQRSCKSVSPHEPRGRDSEHLDSSGDISACVLPDVQRSTKSVSLQPSQRNLDGQDNLHCQSTPVLSKLSSQECADTESNLCICGREKTVLLSAYRTAGMSPSFEACPIIPRLKPKDLCLIPERIAIAAQNDGWWVRSRILWCKPNPMPESVTDRPTDAAEHIWMFTKSERYFWDADAVREPATALRTEGPNAYRGQSEIRPRGPHDAFGYTPKGTHSRGKGDGGPKAQERGSYEGWADGTREVLTSRNMRNVWMFATQPYSEAHFATFPEELPRRCILAATSAKGACIQCSAPWERVTGKAVTSGDSWNGGELKSQGVNRNENGDFAGSNFYKNYLAGKTISWRPTCTCRGQHGKTTPCVVLDPFAGSGTVGRVAIELNRRAILVDLAYQELAEQRTRNVQMRLGAGHL